MRYLLHFFLNARLACLALVFFAAPAWGQSFVNGDLEGPLPLQFGLLAPGWQQLDPMPEAPTPVTTDLLSLHGPNPEAGIWGKPYSGHTFMSGLVVAHQLNNRYQEGIKQTVTGFTPDSSYTIGFWQSVVKQANSLDRSGSWAVYVDGQLVQVTQPSYSPLYYADVNLSWEHRTVNFRATAPHHTIEFRVHDDDPNIMHSLTDITGALRMGIDSIYLQPRPCNLRVSLGTATDICEGQPLVLSPGLQGASYRWSDGSTGATLTVSQAGTYWVEVEQDHCLARAEITLLPADCEMYLEMPNIFSPNHDGVNETFAPIRSKGLMSAHLIVLNQWGNRVFESDALEVAWDGNSDGRALPEGVYFYRIRYEGRIPGPKEVNGWVNIVR